MPTQSPSDSPEHPPEAARDPTAELSTEPAPEPPPAGAPLAARQDGERLLDVIDAMAELATTAEEPLTTILHKIADLARRLAGAEYAALGVPNQEGYLGQFIVSGIDEEAIRAIGHWPRGHGLLGALIRERRAIRLRDMREDQRSYGVPEHHPEMTSFLGVPILWKGRALGNLYITNKRGAEEFSEEDQRIIETLAAHAAVAIENARLFEEIRGLNRRLYQATQEARAAVEEERRVRETAEALAAVAGDILAEVELPKLLDTLALRARELTRADLAGVATVDAETGQATWRATAGFRTIAPHSVATPSCQGLASRAMATRGPIVVRLDDDEGSAGEFPVLTGEGARVVLGVPLLTGGQAFGVLAIAFRSEHELTQREVSVAQALAGHASVAIENARLVDSLRKLSQAREEEVKLISHDLRAPLTIILGQAQMLSRFLAAGNREATLRSAEAIERAAKRMNELIQDLVEAARLETGRVELRREPVSLPAFLTDLRTRLAGVVDAARIRVDAPPDLPPAWADPGRLERILTNLLTNAAKYSPPTSEIQVRVQLGRAGQLVVAVADRGVGIAAAELPRLFQRYYRAAQSQSAEGLGLGLYITRRLVEAHGGRVWAESEGPSHGSAFYFTLPVAPTPPAAAARPPGAPATPEPPAPSSTIAGSRSSGGGAC